jgi:hypothetical protein
MFFAVLGCIACVAAGPLATETARSASTTNALAAYNNQKAKAGADADPHVRLALWCERNGLENERLKHLAIAVLKDPANASARGLLGLVAFRGQWQSPEAIRAALTADERRTSALSEYGARRARMDNSAVAHWKLALWCKQHGLDTEATVHLTIVTQLDPGRAAAWKRLGFKKLGGRWVTEEESAGEKAEAEAQRKADKHWMAILPRLRNALEDGSRHDEAIKSLEAVTDPRAVPSVWQTFACGKAPHQKTAVWLLGQIEAVGSTRVLAILAVAGQSAEVRRLATETLRRRDPRDIAAFMVGLLRDPQVDDDPILYHYRLQPVGWDEVGSQGVLFVQGPLYDVLRTYPLRETRMFQDPSGFIPTAPMVGYERRVIRLRQQQAADLAAIVGQILSESAAYVEDAKRHVRRVDELNAQVIGVLAATTGHDLSEDRHAWRKWWAEEQGFTYQPPPPGSRQDLTLSDYKPMFAADVSVDCFVAGTPIHTVTGLRPIESVAVGDQVLTQNPRTGALNYRPVVATVRGKSEPVVTINLGPQSISATHIERFWKVGKGWVMARELKPGDVLRALGGVAVVENVARTGSEPVFNLTVLQAESFFVGDRGMLVHDNSLIEPVDVPFDALPRAEGARYVR